VLELFESSASPRFPMSPRSAITSPRPTSFVGGQIGRYVRDFAFPSYSPPPSCVIILTHANALCIAG
jgi:hypothetical protein